MKQFYKRIIFIMAMLITVTSYATYSNSSNFNINNSQQKISNFSDPLVQEAVKVWISKNSCGYPNDIDKMLNLVNINATKRNLDPFLVVGLIRQESCFYTKARSNMNAQGYMQVIPRWHPEKVKGRSLYTPEVGIDVGTMVMREYIDRYGEASGLKMYSGGASSYYGGVLKYKKSLIAHTNTYVASREKKYQAPEQYGENGIVAPIGKVIVKANNVEVNELSLVDKIIVIVSNGDKQLKEMFNK